MIQEKPRPRHHRNKGGSRKRTLEFRGKEGSVRFSVLGPRETPPSVFGVGFLRPRTTGNGGVRRVHVSPENGRQHAARASTELDGSNGIYVRPDAPPPPAGSLPGNPHLRAPVEAKTTPDELSYASPDSNIINFGAGLPLPRTTGNVDVRIALVPTEICAEARREPPRKSTGLDGSSWTHTHHPLGPDLPCKTLVYVSPYAKKRSVF